MTDLLVRAIGWRALMLHGDPCVVDRWMFARRVLRTGGMRTLDAGAGNGGFAMMAASRGNEVLGLSFAEEELNAARRRSVAAGVAGVSFRVGDLRELDSYAAELGKFDQIICLEVIEHVHEDQELIERLAGLLAPGGRLIVSSPSADHRAQLGEQLDEAENGGHVRWGYEPARLREMVEAAGLSVVEQGAVSGVVSQQLTNLGRWGSRISTRLGWLLVLPLRPLQLLDRPLTRVLRWPYLCVTVVADAAR